MKTRIMMVREGRRRESQVLDSPQVVFNFLRPKALRLDREYLWRVDLDARSTMLGFEVVSIGTLSASLVHPREILKGVLLSNAAAFIVAHNHPSQDCSPSAEDRDTTRRLRQAGEIMGVPLLDHMIVTDNAFYSFKEHGLL